MSYQNRATVSEEQCERHGLDPKEVLKIAQGITRYMRKAQKIGLELFGNSGTGLLCVRDESDNKVIVAELAPLGLYDGGEETWHDDTSGW